MAKSIERLSKSDILPITINDLLQEGKRLCGLRPDPDRICSVPSVVIIWAGKHQSAVAGEEPTWERRPLPRNESQGGKLSSQFIEGHQLQRGRAKGVVRGGEEGGVMINLQRVPG